MTNSIEQRLAELGIELPKAVAPVANYTPFVISGNLVFISGQGPMGPKGLEYTGKCGAGIDIETAQKAARLTALNVLAQLRAACGGDLGRVRRCVRIEGFVNATSDFTQHPAVINGASDVIVAILGPIGVHARYAVGVDSLPFGMTVEIAAIFDIEPV